MMHIVEANVDIRTVPIIPRSHIYKSTHVPICCSHAPHAYVLTFPYTRSYLSTRHSCLPTSMLPHSPQARNMFMCAINLFPYAQYRLVSHFGTPESPNIFNFVFIKGCLP